MNVVKTEAVVLGHTNLVESHRIITFYTPEQGQIRGVAHGVKGLKSRFGSALEPLTFVNLIYKVRPNRDLQSIEQADIIQSFEGMRRDIVYLTSGLYTVELIQKLTPAGGIGSPALFMLLLKALDLFAQKADLMPLLRIFEARLLGLLGYRPHLEQCLKCKAIPSGYGWGFVPSMGGLVCPACKMRVAGALPISVGGIMFLRQALQMDLERITRLRLLPSGRGELEIALQESLAQHLSSPLKSYPILKRFLEEKMDLSI